MDSPKFVPGGASFRPYVGYEIDYDDAIKTWQARHPDLSKRDSQLVDTDHKSPTEENKEENSTS